MTALLFVAGFGAATVLVHLRLGGAKVQTRAGSIALIHLAIAAPLLVGSRLALGIDPLAPMLGWGGAVLCWFVVRSHLESSVLIAMLEDVEAGCTAPDELLRRFQQQQFAHRIAALDAGGLVRPDAGPRRLSGKGSLVLRFFAWVGGSPELSASGARTHPSRRLR